MSDRPALRVSSLARMGLIATSLVGSLALGGGSLVAVAQDATPDASPMAECVPAEMSTGSAEVMASPDAATPVAEVEVASTPADDATIEAATAAIDNIVACSSDPAALAALVTPNLVATHPFGGYATIEEAMADGFFEEAPYANGVDINRIRSYEDGTVGADTSYMQSQYQLVGEEMILIEENGVWKLNAVAPVRVEFDGDSTAVGVSLGENEDGTYFITPAAESAPATDLLILQATNVGQEPHEMIMLQLPEGADPAGLLDGSIAEEDVNFIGVVVTPKTGDIADMNLVGLPIGVYTLACFFDSPDGAPHAAHGMVAQFEVTAPAE
jgi:hypothetical protein